MSYNDRNSYDDDNFESADNENYVDDYFAAMMRKRRRAAEADEASRRSVEKPRRRNRVVDDDRSNTKEYQQHYTARDPERKRRRQQELEQRRRYTRSNNRNLQSRGGSPQAKRSQAVSRNPAVNSAVRKKPSVAYSANAKRQKQNNGKQSSTIIVATCCLLIIVSLLASMAVNDLYTSKSLFSDDGANDADDTTIQERLITAEENKDKVTYFLIVGVDKSTKLTDCIWILCFDNAAHQMNVMQIPRDTYVGDASPFPHKVNSVYGNPQTVNWCETCDCAVKRSEMTNRIHNVCGKKVGRKTESNISALIRFINNYLGLPIDHYVLFDFAGFEKVVDAMGGVDITLDEELRVYPNKKDYVTLPAGKNHLDGAMALKFMRNRQAYTEGDLGRVKAQRKIIHAMFEKVTDMSVLEILSVLTAAYGNFSTDMSIENIRSFISPVKKCGADALNMFEMPGYSHWGIPHSTHQSYYVCYKGKTLEAINTYLMPYGDKLTAEDINFPVPVD
ncbi:MAG: LCP family protein [Acutalibacteraceae bacterium]